MNWSILESEDQLKQLDVESNNQKIIIFKHSTRCSISSMALNRLEKNWNDATMKEIKPYFLDLIRYRNLSNQIAEMYSIDHESPQVLIISDGRCVYDASHSEISYDSISSQL